PVLSFKLYCILSCVMIILSFLMILLPNVKVRIITNNKMVAILSKVSFFCIIAIITKTSNIRLNGNNMKPNFKNLLLGVNIFITISFFTYYKRKEPKRLFIYVFNQFFKSSKTF